MNTTADPFLVLPTHVAQALSRAAQERSTTPDVVLEEALEDIETWGPAAVERLRRRS